jgi:hypothetical protein
MRVLYLDCFSGISGDMTVGALIDAGADLEKMRQALATLDVPGFEVKAEKITKRGLAATQFHVIQDAQAQHPHRHLGHIVEIIRRAALPETVKSAAAATFERLARAEAAVHNTTVEQVHFHEVGAVDSIVDVVAANYALHLLGVDQVFASVLHVGGGVIHCAHGVLPVPAPATARLLEGMPVHLGGVEAELVTPTGAALVAQWVKGFGPAPAMTIDAEGYGSGTRDLPDRANVLRVLLGETTGAGAQRESIAVVETNLDDMTCELLPVLTAALLAEGARDAFITPVIGKKGRPAHVVTALCEEGQLTAVCRAMFQHSATFGLRIRREERLVLERHWETVRTPWGPVRVKIGMWNGARHVAAPEFEECRAAAEAAGAPVRRVYEAALAAALKGEFEHG